MYASTRVRFYRACKLRVRLAWRAFQHAKTLLGRFTMENGISTNILPEKLFVYPKTVYLTGRLYRTFLNTGDVKSCRLGRPSGSVSLFEHEEYILMECILQTPQIQLHEIVNHIFNATGSAFSPQTLCRTVYRLGITRKKVSRSHF